MLKIEARSTTEKAGWIGYVTEGTTLRQLAQNLSALDEEFLDMEIVYEGTSCAIAAKLVE